MGLTNSIVRDDDVTHASERSKTSLEGVRETDLRPYIQLQVKVGGYCVENDTQEGERIGRCMTSIIGVEDI